MCVCVFVFLQVINPLSRKIWASCDSTHSGSISRDGFYRSLALTAIAQQGKMAEEKSLQYYAENGGEGGGREGGRELCFDLSWLPCQIVMLVVMFITDLGQIVVAAAKILFCMD